jgi:hypothetical protein
MSTTTSMNYSVIMTEPLYTPAPLGGTNDRMLAAYADALRGHVIEGFRILEAVVRADWMPQLGDYIRVFVVIDDPPEGTKSWPSPRVSALHTAVRDAAMRFCIVEHIHVRSISLRGVVRVGLPADVIARARAAAERPSAPTQT